MPDLFFYRDPEEAEKEERERAEAAAESQLASKVKFAAPAKEEWGAEEVTDWAADGQPAPAAAAVPVAIAAPVAAAAATFQVTDDWAAQTETSDWAAASATTDQAAPAANTWGGSSQW